MKICSVIVTYNRIDDLKRCINSYNNQVENVDTIIIVNNNSTDKTKEYLEQWKFEKENYNKIVINLEKNLGGSGGFYEGIKYATNNKFDWIWIHDDDAYLEKETIRTLIKKIKENKKEEISAICGEVINNGKIDIMHRRNLKQGKIKLIDEPISEEKYKENFFYINTFSYVGVAINTEKIEKVGYTNKDFFIYNDDIDHSYRLSKVGKIICYPAIKIIHNVNKDNLNKTTWKMYYGIRNQLVFIKNNFNKINYLYYYNYILLLLMYKRFKHDNQTANLMLKALKDGKNNKLGIDELYKPGWKYE